MSPLVPTNLRFEKLAESRGQGLNWDAPEIALDGDSASKYVIYQFEDLNPQEEDFQNPSNIWKVQNRNYSSLDKSDQAS